MIPVASLLWLGGCAAANPVDGFAAIGTKMPAPPAAARRTIDAAVAHWARSRFTPSARRWLMLKPGLPCIAVMKAIANRLRKRQQCHALGSPVAMIDRRSRHRI